ncbi:ParB/RepB/Spo0J family partition protein [Brucella pecoris]|nr:ParB N-terminal domain-containing protein [Brucella pecoris]MBB4094087.1 ParB family chromosome partitioning protein [Brucella pecoris]
MSQIMNIKTDEIFIVGNRRPLNQDAVARLADSISNIGLQTPITVRLTDVLDPEDGEYTRAFVLITGHHRLEAYKVLGLDRIPAIIRNCDEIEAQLWEIAENLHRAELTALERDEQVAKWIELSTERISSQVETKIERGRPEGGVSAAARDLNISKPDAHRAVKVASLSEEAKEAAREVGLDNNRSVLLNASKEEDPAKQVEVIKQKAERKSLKQQVDDASFAARDAKATADDFNRQLQELRKELAKLRDDNDTLRHELAYARSGTTAKPDDISQEHFDSMVKAMLAYREAMRISSEKPSNLSPRSDEYRLSKDSVLQAQSNLWNSFFPDDEEEHA